MKLPDAKHCAAEKQLDTESITTLGKLLDLRIELVQVFADQFGQLGQ
jgi:hypothetical protein